MLSTRKKSIVIVSAAFALLAGTLAVWPPQPPAGPGDAQSPGADGPGPEDSSPPSRGTPDLSCTVQTQSAPARKGDPDARKAAQRGLDFLSTAAVSWQQERTEGQCYGCHVQAVTLEAFAVGRRHQYDVSDDAYQKMVYGLTDIAGGARSEIGFNYAQGRTLRAPALAFGGAALARHDQWVDAKLSDDLLATAKQLLDYVRDDGSIKLDWTNPPVGVGHVQGAYQAIVTFQQAYARSADDRWLTNVQRSEAYLQKVVDGWGESAPGNIQDVNYAVLGLLAAGTGSQEASMRRLKTILLDAQMGDGGWGFALDGRQTTPAREPNVFPDKFAELGTDRTSNAFATGQTLYALRMLGLDDDDDAVSRGTDWLIKAQGADGGWSNAGYGKAEAMWGVLGLVSLDVLSVSVTGIDRGQHVDGTVPLSVEAWDNSGAKVVQIDLYVDDVHVTRACGDHLAFDWDASSLEDGKHIVELRAQNDREEESRRSLEVFAGDVYLTQAGTEFDDGGTRITLRDIAPEKMQHSVTVDIFAAADDGTRRKDQKLRSLENAGAQGPMSFVWDGSTDAGDPARRGGKYVARLSFRDADGEVLQTEEVTFVHDTLASQQANFGAVTGQLRLQNDEGRGATNTLVELLDGGGNVVQSTRSTKTGNYRFRNVDAAHKYKVRVRKKGFEAQEQELPEPTAAGEVQAADFAL